MHCPSDETLAAHLVGAPLDGGSEPVRAHLDTCDVCRELMIAMARQAPEDLDLAATNPVLPVWPEATTPTVAAADYEFLPTIDPSHYVLGNSLARGGMGRIRVARDRRLGRNVAIKELLVASEVMRQRFEREVRITARLQHPAIVSVIEAGTWPSGEPFFAMKLVSGTSLDRVIASRPTVAERLGLLPSVIAASDALGYAHAEHVIHRDLKPQNILVGDFGETVVIDWGLAKDLDEAAGMTSGEQRLREAAETVDGTVNRLTNVPMCLRSG